MTLERDIDRAVERARDREWDRLTAPPALPRPHCPECGSDMDWRSEDAWECKDCRIVVEYYGPEEDAPNGGCVVTQMEE